MTGFYLSDVAHNTMRRNAANENVTLARYINNHWAEWVALDVVVRDEGVKALIGKRAVDVRSLGALERGDIRPPKFKSRPEHDGVVWLAMFGAWKRRKREVRGVEADAIEALATWVVNEGVVRRRAASETTLASQALELIGRGWVKPHVADEKVSA